MTHSRSQPMTAKHRKWLDLCDMRAGNYPGIQSDRIPPSVADHLYRSGMIAPWIPSNPDHKERWITTDAGRAALKDQPK